MKFRIGDVVDIYRNAQTREGPEGKAKLLKYVRTSDPFIIAANPVSEKLTLSYILEYWIVKLDDRILLRPVRAVNSIGETSSNFYEEHIFNNTPMTNLTEDFYILKGYDTSFWDSRVSETECSGSMY